MDSVGSYSNWAYANVDTSAVPTFETTAAPAPEATPAPCLRHSASRRRLLAEPDFVFQHRSGSGRHLRGDLGSYEQRRRGQERHWR